MFICYVGFRRPNGEPQVFVCCSEGCVQVDPRLDLWRYGDGRLDWGRKAKDGSRQLALALLAHATGSDLLAVKFADLFAREVTTADFELMFIPGDNVRQWICDTLSHSLAMRPTPGSAGPSPSEN